MFYIYGLEYFLFRMKQLHINFQNVLIAIVILSGVLNNFVNAYLFSINVTLFTFIIVLLDIFYNIFSKNIFLSTKYIFILLAIFLFYCLMIVSLVYSPSQSYKYTKSINFIINILLFTYPIFIRELKLDKIMRIIKWTAIFLSIFFIYERYRYWLPSNYSIRGSNNFSFVHLGIGVNLSITLIYESFKKKWITVMLLLSLLIGMGSRGSFLFSVLTLLIFHYKYFIYRLFNFKLKKQQLYLLTIVIFVLSVILYKYHEKISEVIALGVGRFESLINFSEDKSALGRLYHYEVALNNIFTNIFTILLGFGIGSFGIITHNQDIRWYPHNIFLEAWFELGIFGMILLMIIILRPFFTRTKGDNKLKAMYTFLFFEAMKSSNISDLWILFLFLSIFLVYRKTFLNEI